MNTTEIREHILYNGFFETI